MRPESEKVKGSIGNFMDKKIFQIGQSKKYGRKWKTQQTRKEWRCLWFIILQLWFQLKTKHSWKRICEL